MATPSPPFVYKLLSKQEWTDTLADGKYEGSPHDKSDGFMHMSSAEETRESCRRYYASVPHVVLLQVDYEKIKADTKWQAAQSRNGALFPHLLRPLSVTEVVGVFDLVRDSEGQFCFPEELALP
eukprot:GILK01007519.1.p1 GENE.GILK01007519.1~~GILK01007519.1.p1  ORF type:complete len:140 (-),score=11.88 GILK01007519.1:66-437(-)